MPTNDSQIKHFMRDKDGHLPNTLENRKLLEDLANDKNYHIGKDRYGNECRVRNPNQVRSRKLDDKSTIRLPRQNLYFCLKCL